MIGWIRGRLRNWAQQLRFPRLLLLTAVVFGVNVDDDVAAAREFASGQKLQFPMLLDPAKTVARAYRVDAMPMLVAIDRFGKVRYLSRNDKPTAAAEYVPALRTLIDE